MEKINIDGRWHYIVACSVCGKECYRRKCFLDKYSKIFCSDLCSSKGKRKKVEVKCNNCGKNIEKDPSQIKKSKSGYNYCSASCAISKNNTITKTKENPFTYRQKALKIYGTKCSNTQCELKDKVEITKEMLDVDHIDSNRDNNKIDNLQVLCIWCHRKKTFKKWKESKKNRAIV